MKQGGKISGAKLAPEKLAPLRRETLHETANAEIRSALTSGCMKMGESLTLRSLASTLGISEAPVREAVRRLVTEGALEAIPNRSISVPVMTRAKLEEQRQVSVTLEGLATEMAVPNLTAADAKQLKALDGQMVAAGKAGDIATVLARNSDFHMTLYRASRSELLVDLIQITWLRAGPLLTLVEGRPEMMKNAKTAHAALAENINAAAEQLDAVLGDDGGDDSGG